jgi:hypothetical protein
MLPERREGPDSSGVVAALQELAQALALRAAIHRIFRVIDIDLELGGEEVAEAGVGKLQHKAGTSYEVDEIIHKTKIDGPYRANKPSSRPLR